MNDIVIFGHNENEEKLDDISQLIKLLHGFIIISDDIISLKENLEVESYDGACYLFAKSIMNYIKGAYDNFVLGHFNEAYLIIRTVIENYVCFKIILEYKEKELWKYWIVHSEYISSKKFRHGISEYSREKISILGAQFKLEVDFLSKGIENNYGWLYKIKHESFSFRKVCNLLKKDHVDYYLDYAIACESTHGTALNEKLDTYLFNEKMWAMLSVLVLYIQYLMETYCVEELPFEYFEIKEMIYDYFDEKINFSV